VVGVAGARGRRPAAGASARADAARFAWYGAGCPCGVPAGECREHPRARPGQRPPEGDWRVFLLLGGRGAGKTRTAAELVRHWVETGCARHVGLIGATAADVRDTMVQGPSGLLSIAPPWSRPRFEPSKRRLSWPNGAMAICLSSEEPERARGLQFDHIWADELCCLAAGTRVETGEGPKRIEDIVPGELVQTRVGLRRVLDAWQSSPCAPVYRLTISTGETLIGTGNHRVWTGNRGWIRIDALVYGETILSWKTHQHASSHGSVVGGGRREAGEDPDTPRAAHHASHATRRTPPATRHPCVSDAVSSTRARTHVPRIAAPLAKLPTVVSVERLLVKLPVYDLHVEDAHEFFADRILVHNCWQYPQRMWDLALLGLRMGTRPQAVVTTTPKPIAILRKLLDQPTTRLSRETTFANTRHLAPEFIDQITALYAGSRLGRQELMAEIVETSEAIRFPMFEPARHVTTRADYLPGLPVKLAIDCGLSRHVGAVWFQVRERDAYRRIISVFADYHAVDKTSEVNALAIRARAREVCGGRLDAIYLDPASTARSGVGPAARGEFARVLGERITTTWPDHRVLEGLDQIEILLGGPDREPDLIVHPRCAFLIESFQTYRRAERRGEILDWPEDPQHPAEEALDSLRGAVRVVYPEGRVESPRLRQVHAGRIS
jgi:hypothetical protein